MSLKAKLKDTIKQCLIRKCDREYDRIYQHALKQRGYGRLIADLEAAQGIASEGATGAGGGQESTGKVVVYPYTWNKEIDAESLKALAGEVVLMCEEDAYLHVSALALVEKWFADHEETQVLYGDEDVVDEDGNRSHPWLKPSWSPTLFEKVHYVGALVAVRKNLLKTVLEQWKDGDARTLIWQICREAGGFNKGGNAIAHAEAVLCHHPFPEAYEKFLHCAPVNGEQDGFGDKKMTKAEVERERKPLVSIIIPSKDHPEILEQNLRSLKATVAGIDAKEVELLIVDNGSSEENRKKIEKLKEDLIIEFKYIYKPMEFNFSSMCNLGAEESRGELLLFLNDDVEAKQEGWLDAMATKALCERNGCVGAKLLYPGTDQIQHAGIVNLPMGPVHKLQFLSDSETHYFERNKQDLEVMAVTGACLMLRRDVFDEVGGFEEDLPVAFNDVDLCYKVYAKGYYNVCMNSVWLYHHESLSRGEDESAEKLQRLMKEKAKLYERHKMLEGVDSFYPGCLNRRKLDTRILPALEECLYPEWESVAVQTWTEDCFKDMRRHDGVICRVERQDGGEVQGYLFMVGDDNACYEKRLMFTETNTQAKYWCRLNTCLREDLEKNMPDQRNVALCGFYVKLQGLPKGRYEITGVAHNKISGVTYTNKTARILSLTEE